MLKRQPNAESVGLLTAEREINEYLSTLDGLARQSELERIREAALMEAKERPKENNFWTSVGTSPPNCRSVLDWRSIQCNGARGSMADTSLWPVIVGGLLGMSGTMVGVIGATIRDAAQQRHEKTKRRADKFEELVAAVYEFDYWLTLTRQRELQKIEGITETVSPFAKVQSISSVYFPQFSKSVRELDAVSSRYVAWIYNPQDTTLSGTGKLLEFVEIYKPYIDKREALLDALSESARDLIL